MAQEQLKPGTRNSRMWWGIALAAALVAVVTLMFWPQAPGPIASVPTIPKEIGAQPPSADPEASRPPAGKAGSPLPADG